MYVKCGTIPQGWILCMICRSKFRGFIPALTTCASERINPAALIVNSTGIELRIKLAPATGILAQRQCVSSFIDLDTYNTGCHIGHGTHPINNRCRTQFYGAYDTVPVALSLSSV